MTVIFEKMAMMVVLMAAGYLFAKLKIVGPEFNRGLSKLIMNFFLVGMILSSVVNKELNMTGKDIIAGLGLWFLLITICICVGWLTPRVFRLKGDMGIYTMLVAYMNNAFVGFPLVTAVYGTEILFFTSLSNISFNVTLYTVGMLILSSGHGDGKLDPKRIINTPIIATLVAVLIFATRVHMPQFVEDTVNCVASATVPLSMMCVGLSLGSVKIKDAFSQPRLYLLAFMRLIACPILVWLVLRGLISDPVMLGAMVIVASTPSAVICTILGIEFGRDGIESSEGILLTTVLSMITIPCIISILGL